MVGARAGSLLSAAEDGTVSAPPKLPPPRAQALGGDAQPLGHPLGWHAALPLRDRRALERLVVGPRRRSWPRSDFFAAQGVHLPPPRAAVHFYPGNLTCG